MSRRAGSTSIETSTSILSRDQHQEEEGRSEEGLKFSLASKTELQGFPSQAGRRRRKIDSLCRSGRTREQQQEPLLLLEQNKFEKFGYLFQNL
jgi:hypothetical protein